MATEIRIEDLVHQLDNGRWVYARWDQRAGQYHAPMTASERRVTGCHTYSARRLENLGCTSYATKAGAMRRVRGDFEVDARTQVVEWTL